MLLMPHLVHPSVLSFVFLELLPPLSSSFSSTASAWTPDRSLQLPHGVLIPLQSSPLSSYRSVVRIQVEFCCSLVQNSSDALVGLGNLLCMVHYNICVLTSYRISTPRHSLPVLLLRRNRWDFHSPGTAGVCWRQRV